jgi:hypothetical protein
MASISTSLMSIFGSGLEGMELEGDVAASP